MSNLHGLLPRHEALVAERQRITDALGLPSDVTADTIVGNIEETKRRMAKVNAKLDQLIAQMEAYL